MQTKMIPRPIGMYSFETRQGLYELVEFKHGLDRKQVDIIAERFGLPLPDHDESNQIIEAARHNPNVCARLGPYDWFFTAHQDTPYSTVLYCEDKETLLFGYKDIRYNRERTRFVVLSVEQNLAPADVRALERVVV